MKMAAVRPKQEQQEQRQPSRVILKPRKEEPSPFVVQKVQKRSPFVVQKVQKRFRHKVFVDHTLGIAGSGSDMLELVEQVHVDEINKICFAQVHWNYPEDSPHILLESECEYRLKRAINLCLERVGEVQAQYLKMMHENSGNDDAISVKSARSGSTETVQMDTDLDIDMDQNQDDFHYPVWV